MLRITVRFWICGGLLFGQGPRVSISPTARTERAVDKGPSAKLRVDSNLVLVPVLVTDHLDRPVLGLQKPNFRVYDDKQEQQITHFAMEDAPVSVVLVFDKSGSMGKKLQTSRQAVREFVDVSNPADEFALVEFADRPQLIQKFSDEKDQIPNRLAFQDSRGGTALIDAVCLALEQMGRARHARKAIVLISDGGDNSSRYRVGDLRNRIREADVQIYSIGVMESISLRGMAPEVFEGATLLDDISKLSGGRFFQAQHDGSVLDIAKRIGLALRNEYLLGYSPPTPKQDGRYHRITVKLEPPEGHKKLRASFRSSYLSQLR